MAARDERRSATVAVSSDRSLDWKVVANILSKVTKLREYTKGVENNLWQVELESIQDYIKESDNLLSLHDQIHDCDSILSQMETLLSGFQAEIGSISSDIKVLQEKSMDMGLKLKNRKVAESKLAKFVEDTIVPPRMIDIIVDGEGRKDKNGTRTQLGLSDKKNRRKNVSLCREERCKPLGEREWYFFTPRDRKYRKGNRPNRAAGDGYWKATGANKPVKLGRIIIGYKKSLVFYLGKPPMGYKTDWMMHEFTLNAPSRKPKNANDMRLDDWVLCRVYKKPKNSKEAKQLDQPELDNYPVAATLSEEKTPCVNNNNNVAEMNWDNNSMGYSSQFINTCSDFFQSPLLDELLCLPP